MQTTVQLAPPSDLPPILSKMTNWIKVLKKNLQELGIKPKLKSIAIMLFSFIMNYIFKLSADP